MSLLPPPRWRLCDRVILSVCSLAQKSYTQIYMKFLLNVGLAQSQGDFILEVIRIELSSRGHSGPARSVRHKIDYGSETVRDTAEVTIEH